MSDNFGDDFKIEDITDIELEESKDDLNDASSPQLPVSTPASNVPKEPEMSVEELPTTDIDPIENGAEEDDDQEEDDFEDETLSERLWALTEMFPESVRKATWGLSTSSVNGAKGFYQFARSALWVISTSAIILAAPTLIESEKAQLDEYNRQQQRQILLGPSASMSGTPNLTPSLTPPQAAS